MFYDDTLAGSWSALVDRVDGGAVLPRWAAAEPALAGVSRMEVLAGLVRVGADPARADGVIGALVRLAAADGGRDDDALLVLLHLLSDMVLALAARLADLTPDVLGVIVGELACQIRAYPWRRRSRAWAANLRAETRRAVLAEFRPWARRHPECAEQPWNPLSADWAATPPGGSVPGPGEGGDLDVVDLLQWAVRRGVDADDVALLIATERGRDEGAGSQDRRVAAEQGVALRTFYRRRERTLTALRDVARDYLAAVA